MGKGLMAIYEGSLAANGTFVLSPAGGDFAANRNRQIGKPSNHLTNAREILEVARFNRASLEVDADGTVTAFSVEVEGTMGDPATAVFQEVTPAIAAAGISEFDCAVSYLRLVLAGYTGAGEVRVRLRLFVD